MRFNAQIRNASEAEIKSMMAISELANPELHAPLRSLRETSTQEQLASYHKKLIRAVATYLEFAHNDAKHYFKEYTDDLALQPDKREALLEKYRDHHIGHIHLHQRYSYLYTDYVGKEYSVELLSLIANDLWRLAYEHNERLVDALWLLQKICSHYLTVQNLNLQQNTSVISDSKQETSTATPASDERQNVFNTMPLDDVKKWFMQLAETNSKNGSPFLMVEQVGQFIDRAFCGNSTIQALKLNMTSGERTSVTKLFYLFYNQCTNDYAIETTKHCKEKYVRLLTDNFTNYNYNTVFGTFNNSKNAPKEWKTTV